MCFSALTPDIPKTPPIPTPPNPADAMNRAKEEAQRRAGAITENRLGTVLTAPLGDVGFNRNVGRPRLAGVANGGPLGTALV
jgi:hypothetical protein